MSTIGILPLLTLTYGVGGDEDFNLSIAYYLADGVTPIPLTGISFTASLTGNGGSGGSGLTPLLAQVLLGLPLQTSQSSGSGTLATFTMGTGITIGGSASNIITLFIAAANKTNWPDGNYVLALTANDGTYTKDLLRGAIVEVGTPVPAQISPVIGDAPIALNVLLAASAQQAAMQTAIALLQAQIDAIIAGNNPPSGLSPLLAQVTLGLPL